MVLPLRFVPYHRLDGGTPNVVVDGSAGPGTVLTLSHWPGSPTPVEVRDDLSAQIAFRSLGHPDWFDGVEAVSNNHFDQDGLVSVFVLSEPDAALARRDRLVDVASAGDFGTFVERDAARVSMAVAAFAVGARSPVAGELADLGYQEQCGVLYQAALDRLVGWVDRPASARSLWEEEDAHLDESLRAIESGAVTIEEVPGLDLAWVTVAEDRGEHAARRFSGMDAYACHPMAIHHATACTRVMIRQGARFELRLRYEGWVMFVSRDLPARPDLRVLAVRLDEIEPNGPCWSADPPDAMTPSLRSRPGSDLAPDVVRRQVEEFLRTAPRAWDPFPVESTG